MAEAEWTPQEIAILVIVAADAVPEDWTSSLTKSVIYKAKAQIEAAKLEQESNYPLPPQRARGCFT